MNDSPREGDEDTPDTREGCRDCDSKQLDRLKCRAKGIKAQSDHNDETLKQLDDDRTAYDGARHAYNEARKTEKPVVERIRLTLSGLIDQLDCLVQNPRKIVWLNNAYQKVEFKLRRCYPCEGCTFAEDCDFDEAVDSCGDDDLETLIATITLRAAVAQTAFDDLVAEATEIPKRVTKLQADVDKIEADMKVAGADFVALYAAALVARGDQSAIYRGFHNVNDYMDCLCKAFKCVLKGQEAVGRLKGKQAVRKCHEDQRKAQCERLKTQTAEEVIVEYLKLKHAYHEEEEREAAREQEREREEEQEEEREEREREREEREREREEREREEREREREEREREEREREEREREEREREEREREEREREREEREREEREREEREREREERDYPRGQQRNPDARRLD